MSWSAKSATFFACGSHVPLASRGAPLSSCCASQKPPSAASSAAATRSQRPRAVVMGELFHSDSRSGRGGASLTVGALIARGARQLRRARVFFGHGTDNARDEAASLVLHALRLPPAGRAALHPLPLRRGPATARAAPAPPA